MGLVTEEYHKTQEDEALQALLGNDEDEDEDFGDFFEELKSNVPEDAQEETNELLNGSLDEEESLGIENEQDELEDYNEPLEDVEEAGDEYDLDALANELLTDLGTDGDNAQIEEEESLSVTQKLLQAAECEEPKLGWSMDELEAFYTVYWTVILIFRLLGCVDQILR